MPRTVGSQSTVLETPRARSGFARADQAPRPRVVAAAQGDAPVAAGVAATEPARRGDALGVLLARAVQGRAPRATLQRAIIAIDGPNDTRLQKDATANCLHNLKARGTRGKSEGPKDLPSIVPPKLGKTETLYILAHGALDRSGSMAETVGGLDPTQMGAQLRAWYGAQRYSGKIKLVACISAATSATNPKSYADSLRDWLAANATGKFRPASVDGIIGVGWVDETTSQQQSIDLATYLTANPSVFGEKVETTREAAITRELGALGGPGSGRVRVTGKSTVGGGKVRYDVAYPTPPPPTKATRFFRAVRGILMPCIP